jgi:ELWxxDGT repeat protein
MKLRLLLICLLFSVAPAVHALRPYRVADIDPTFHSAGSGAGKFVRTGRRAVFTAGTPALGLWSSDGSPAGTIRLVTNATSIGYIAATGEALFFEGCDPQRCRLQITDGTVAGTRVLPGLASSDDSVAIAGARRIFFVGRSADSPGLWTSDGTAGGTRLVKRFEPGSNGPELHHFVWFRDRLWFFVGDALWISDGKTAGTKKVATVGSVDQAGFVGTRLVFFVEVNDTFNARLWSSDGTAQGTKPLGVVSNLANHLAPFATAGGTAYFLAIEETPDFVHSVMWATDGTAAHTRKLATFDLFDAGPPIALGSRVAFIGGDEAHGDELWVSDGWPGGPRGIDICPGSCSSVEELGAVDGARLWFSARSGNDGSELWTSDGTPAGTRQVEDLDPGSPSSDPHDFIVGDGRAYFATGSFVGSEGFWVSDGTAAGTRRLVERHDPEHSLGLRLGAVVAGRAFLSLVDDSHGSEPWVSDGTVAGTRLIKDLFVAQDGGSFPQVLMPAGDRCFFFPTTDFDITHELWVSNGTAAGTSLAYRFESGFSVDPSSFVSADLGGRLALYRVTGPDSGEILVSDGTPGGTEPIHSTDVRPNGQLRAVLGRLFFQAEDSDHGMELWTSDGRPEGTIRLSDFPNPFPFADRNSDERHGFFEVAGGVAFLVADEFGRFEPWFSDGTIGGTRHLADVYPALVAPFFSLASDVVSAGGKYFFVSGEGAPSLWVSDLTVAGTHSLGPVTTQGGFPASVAGLAATSERALVFYRTFEEFGFWSSDGTDFRFGALVGLADGTKRVPWGDRLVFGGETEETGDSLYVTDGTAVGTVRLTYPNGDVISGFVHLAVLGGRLAFASSNGVWDTDGTPGGTVRRLAPYAGGFLQEFVRAGERIFFPWYDAQHGTEIWALRP